MKRLLTAALCCACLTAPARAETCIASWYGGLTASGARFDQNAMTAAHKTRAFGARVTVSHGSRSVVVTITDRGPFVKGRCIDLSRAAARALGIDGIGQVEVK